VKVRELVDLLKETPQEYDVELGFDGGTACSNIKSVVVGDGVVFVSDILEEERVQLQENLAKSFRDES
jgi:pentose-5-phosphate-3-epimerase